MNDTLKLGILLNKMDEFCKWLDGEIEKYNSSYEWDLKMGYTAAGLDNSARGSSFSACRVKLQELCFDELGVNVYNVIH